MPMLEAAAHFATNPDMAPFMKYLQVTPGYVFSPEAALQAKDMILSNPNMITIGASGSVFGILLGFGMLFPNTPLYLMFIPVPIKAKYMVIGYGLLELFSGISRFSGR